MTSRRLAGAIALVLAVTAACSSAPTATPATTPAAPTDKPAATAPVANGAEVDVATFTAAVGTPGIVVLDVRTPAEFAQGHLQGAVNIDATAADFPAKLDDLDKSASYAVYCRSGSRSARAVAEMLSRKFQHVFHLGGGITAWQQAGQPVTTA